MPAMETHCIAEIRHDGAGAIRCDVALAVIIELDLPAPLGAIGRLPPGLEQPDLTAGQDHRAAEIARVRPAILAGDAVAVTNQAGDRSIGGAVELIAEGEEDTRVVADLNAQRLRRRVNQQHVGRVEPSPSEGQPLRGRIGKPEIPHLHGVNTLLPGSRSWPVQPLLLGGVTPSFQYEHTLSGDR